MESKIDWLRQLIPVSLFLPLSHTLSLSNTFAACLHWQLSMHPFVPAREFIWGYPENHCVGNAVCTAWQSSSSKHSCSYYLTCHNIITTPIRWWYSEIFFLTYIRCRQPHDDNMLYRQTSHTICGFFETIYTTFFRPEEINISDTKVSFLFMKRSWYISVFIKKN